MRLFSSSLFRRKNVEQLIHEMNSGERLNRRLGPVALTGLGIGATIGTGLYVLTGVVAKEVDRAVAGLVVPAGGGGLRIRRALLFRARQHGAGGRQRLYLRIRDSRRAGRLDHRLGPHPRIRHRLECRRRRVVQLSRRPAAQRLACSSRSAPDRCALGL